MINICQKCLHLNPLGSKSCIYCQALCQEIEPADFGQFCINQQKEAKEEQKHREDTLLDYPDLKIFEEYGMMADQEEVILARP